MPYASKAWKRFFIFTAARKYVAQSHRKWTAICKSPKLQTVANCIERVKHVYNMLHSLKYQMNEPEKLKLP